MVSSPDNRPLLDAIAESNTRVGVMMPLRFLKNSVVDRYFFRGSIVARYTFIGFVKSLLQSKKDEKGHPSRRPCVYSILMNSDDGEGLGPNEIAAESTNLIIAGSDTTSTVLAAFFFYLTRCPAAYAQACSEVRSCFNSCSDLSNHARLASCTYLRACIDESMRIAPPVASALFREVESGGAVVDAHFLPAGCEGFSYHVYIVSLMSLLAR
ncbi:hypothetical protein GJ744_008312 [Endocarpon pusillum]|uniref:Cytochrome P450 n=1 Tax=Endocarpon pusillum TaxID=364733 RepID=A0A8H7AH84_9EURO|nr:hypothetical protein GJ744_008312 [Endocarpon pusillum]